MSQPLHHALTTLTSLAALLVVASGDVRPAGLRTAFELLAKSDKARSERVAIVSASRTSSPN